MSANKRYPGFWSWDRLISTGKPVMIAMAGRSIGKTTDGGYQLIKDFINNQNRFLYVRRTDDELKLTCKTYFNGGSKLYEAKTGRKVNLVYDRGEYKDQDGNVYGYSIPLSLVHKVKSNYEGLGIRNIIYDEFNLKPGLERFYLGSKNHPLLEWEQLDDLYVTIDREFGKAAKNTTRLFISGNAESFYNPVLQALHVDKYLQWGKDSFINPKNELWACEYLQKVGATEKIKESNGYRLATDAQKMQDFDNAEKEKDTDILDIRGKGYIVRPIVCMSYAGRKYTMYIVEKEGFVYISTKPRNDRENIALTMGDTTEINQITAYTYRDRPEMSFLRNMVNNGLVRYETEQAKIDILTYLKFTV